MSKVIKISAKEKEILLDLLNMSESGWYSIEVLPKGITNPEQAEQITKGLIKKLQQ